jgi:hypothetical protein
LSGSASESFTPTLILPLKGEEMDGYAQSAPPVKEERLLDAGETSGIPAAERGLGG